MEAIVGRAYIGKVGNSITVVRYHSAIKAYGKTRHQCTNLVTGRAVGFKSMAKFRREVPENLVAEMVEIYR